MTPFRKCLLTGACGDALGGPVEFLCEAEVRARFGPGGIRDYAPAYGHPGGAITDDTQMTLFTLDGLLRDDLPVAYDDWYATQEGAGLSEGVHPALRDPRLRSRRAPGMTCLGALGALKRGRTVENDSKGCGGVMRAAPVGLAYRDPEKAFSVGCESARITHLHRDGWLPAGALAMAVCFLVYRDATMSDALTLVRRRLEGEWPEAGTTVLLRRAIDAAEGGSTALPSELGEGWVGDEAFAIAAYAALATPNLEEAIVLAVNHSGDSDSTGAIAGNLVGADRTSERIPDWWLATLELREEIETLADALERRAAKIEA